MEVSVTCSAREAAGPALPKLSADINQLLLELAGAKSVLKGNACPLSFTLLTLAAVAMLDVCCLEVLTPVLGREALPHTYSGREAAHRISEQG